MGRVNRWAGIAGGVATVGQCYLAQTPSVRAAVERSFRARAREQAAGSGGVLHLENRAVYVLARS